MATYPTLFAGGQFGRKNEDKFEIGTLGHAGLAIEEDAIGADIAGLGSQFPSPYCALDANGDASRNSLAGTPIEIRVHSSSASNYGLTPAERFLPSRWRLPV